MKCLHCGSENVPDPVWEETSLGAIAAAPICPACGRFVWLLDTVELGEKPSHDDDQRGVKITCAKEHLHR